LFSDPEMTAEIGTRRAHLTLFEYGHDLLARDTRACHGSRLSP
jgi:hypothetical protein